MAEEHSPLLRWPAMFRVSIIVLDLADHQVVVPHILTTSLLAQPLLIPFSIWIGKAAQRTGKWNKYLSNITPYDMFLLKSMLVWYIISMEALDLILKSGFHCTRHKKVKPTEPWKIVQDLPYLLYHAARFRSFNVCILKQWLFLMPGYITSSFRAYSAAAWLSYGLQV